jgi:hypothetical protein
MILFRRFQTLSTYREFIVAAYTMKDLKREIGYFYLKTRFIGLHEWMPGR